MIEREKILIKQFLITIPSFLTHCQNKLFFQKMKD